MSQINLTSDKAKQLLYNISQNPSSNTN